MKHIMFTWIPIHEEAAKRMLEFKGRNYELVDIMARMHKQGLKASKITDQDAEGNTFQLKEIDPFTFLGNFNRALTLENRQALWQFLKEEWRLTSEIPSDFEGLPVLQMQASWLIPYASQRSPGHVNHLWTFFEHIMKVEQEELDSELMQTCLDLRNVGLANLTMGMFWSSPNKWIAMDRKNLSYAKSKGIEISAKSAREYVGKWGSVCNCLTNRFVSYFCLTMTLVKRDQLH